jgi:serine/threonine protein kinase
LEELILSQIKLENILLFLDEKRNITLKISDFGLSIAPHDKPILLGDRLGSLHYSAPEFFLIPDRWQCVWSIQQDYFAAGVTIMSLMGCAAPSIEHYLDLETRTFISTPDRMQSRNESIMRRLVRSPFSSKAIEAVAALVAPRAQDRNTALLSKWARPLNEWMPRA